MKTLRLSATLMSVALVGLTLGCDRSGPLAAPSVSAARGLSTTEDAQANEGTVRWNIGGTASALAKDNLTITLTGSGTFKPGNGQEVTGGGTWQTFDASGTSTGSGTYGVTRLVSWERAPASLGAADPTSTAGLAVLRIAYSDESRGILVVSCRIGVTGVFEGVAVSKGFVSYGNVLTPTIFHVLGEEAD